MSKNKVKFGLKNVHFAKMIVSAEDESISYATPVRIPGAVNLSLEPQGDKADFNADDVIFFSDYANNGYSGDLEVAKIPDEFLKEILGQAVDENGALIESSEDKSSKFALMFEVNGDVNAKRVVYYNCSASRPKAEASTVGETKEPKTDTITITASARSTDNLVRASLEPNEKNQTVYDNFYKKVYEKNGTASV